MTSYIRLATKINSLIPEFSLWPAVTSAKLQDTGTSNVYALILPESVCKVPVKLQCDHILNDGSTEFCWSPSFDAEMILDLYYEGFFVITAEIAPQFFILLPKIHKERSVLLRNNFHIERKSKKKSKQYSLTLDKCFDRVCESIVEQHGSNWLCPDLILAFRTIHSRNSKGNSYGISLHSVEVWTKSILVAGELGVIVGGMYLSLTGFRKVEFDGAGTIQLASLFSFLFSKGFRLIDLGMTIPYKQKLGAQVIQRHRFLAWFYIYRDERRRAAISQPSQVLNCNEIIVGFLRDR